MTTKTMVQRFRDGDSLTDEELDILICMLTPAEQTLRLLGPVYHLTWKDIFTDLERLRGYKEARRDNKTKSLV